MLKSTNSSPFSFNRNTHKVRKIYRTDNSELMKEEKRGKEKNWKKNWCGYEIFSKNIYIVRGEKKWRKKNWDQEKSVSVDSVVSLV